MTTARAETATPSANSLPEIINKHVISHVKISLPDPGLFCAPQNHC
jgi:hypothetical protein